MTGTLWTYHEFHHSPRRKTYSVMEGIRPVASCSREKDARLIVSMKETNAELLEALGDLLQWLEENDPNIVHQLNAAYKAIAKAKEA